MASPAMALHMEIRDSLGLFPTLKRKTKGLGGGRGAAVPDMSCSAKCKDLIPRCIEYPNLCPRKRENHHQGEQG